MRISVVSYLNSKPFIDGLKKLPSGEFELSLDIPSECARKLLSGEVEIGLVPVAILQEMPEFHIYSNYCIGAVGKVDSVKLYSQVPLEQITQVRLDYQSRTSVALVKILARELWKINPEWQAATPGYEDEVAGTTAAVIIGDRTFAIHGKFKYEYDLAEAWEKLTGLPFVFAVWTGKKALDPAIEKQFTDALSLGLSNISEVIAENEAIYPGVDIHKYLTQSISYPLDEAKRKALSLFLSKLG